MARQVTSFSELFSSSASESQIFEGLEEIIPQGKLANLEANWLNDNNGLNVSIAVKV